MARDTGELIDETTDYGTWADWLRIPRHTFSTCTRTPDPAWRSCRSLRRAVRASSQVHQAMR